MVADINKKSLIIVESPTKAKTVSGYLKGFPFLVVASKGHIMDLNPSPGPDDGVYGVYVNDGFKLDYKIVEGKEELIKELKKDLKDVSQLILASDEDREGESIAFHLKEVLDPKIPTFRMVFHEITKKAIKEAFNNCRDIDLNLVKAQEARRAIDRLQGYGISPLLSQKLGSKYSAGRVQSPALKLIVEREKLRRNYKESKYYSLEGKSEKDGVSFQLTLTEIVGKKVASSSSFDKETGEIKGHDIILSLEEAEKIKKECIKKRAEIIDVSTKERIEKPQYPFITSTLQQEANIKMGKSSKETMSIAQKLYENGFITYMRTDSPTLSEECISLTRERILNDYGQKYLSKEKRNFLSKNLGAQEAHEAIRPAGDEIRSPEETGLSGDELKLYTLIWKRTLATQMASCIKNVTSASFSIGPYTFTASGTTLIFDGFRVLYLNEKNDDKEDIKLPLLNQGEDVVIKEAEVKEHITQPPARYNEATIVQKLESEEIGRPSTYATIISTLLDKKYVVRQGRALVPTFTGFFVDAFLEKAFSSYIDYDFTKKMERELDEIAQGKLDKVDYLSSFWFGKDSFEGLSKDLSIVKSTTKAGDVKDLVLSNLKYSFTEGNQEVNYEIKTGKFGPYIASNYFDKANGKNKMASIDEKKYFPGTFSDAEAREILFQAEDAVVLYDKYQLRNGKFGTYFVRLSDNKSISYSPKKGNPEDLKESFLDLIFELPVVIGKDKEGNEASLRLGPYGFYAQYKGKNIRVQDPENVKIEDLEKGKSSGVITSFGEKEGKKLEIVNGKYGPYVKWGEMNAPLSQEYKENPSLVTEEIALKVAKAHEEKAGAATAKKSEKDFILTNGENVYLLNGRYGYYLKRGEENIPLPQSVKKNPFALSEKEVEEIVLSFKPKEKSKKRVKKAK